jgi:hypothetical protein
MAIDLNDVRDAVLAWAARHGVLSDTAISDPGVNVGDPSILPFETEHADYFRTRKIVRVVVEARGQRRSLKIFSRMKLAQTKITQLRRLFEEQFADSKIKLEIGVSKPFKVDQAVQSYGRFEPIRRHQERIACGSSVGIGNQRNAGTLAALATHEEDQENIYGISCNHVVGGCSTARLGTPIVVPGIQDVSADHDEITVIGVHFSAAPMSQGLPSVFNISPNRDLACFQVTAPDEVTSMQGSGKHSYDTPGNFARVTIGMAVKKWGRSTRLTYGKVCNILIDEPVPYKVTSYYGPMNSQVFKGTVYFKKIYEVEPSGSPTSYSSPFSLGGDSGALVVSHSDAAEEVVGIVIAGGQDKSLVLPLQPALEALKLKLLSNYKT